MVELAANRPQSVRWWDLARLRGKRPKPGRSRASRRSSFDALESREMLSGAGTDYVLEGGQWDTSRPVTFSFAPDGVAWDKGTNSVNATLDAEFGGTGWQSIVARALQTWSAASNLNFVEVPDGAYSFNTVGSAQGDPRFGDIRVAGFSFGVSSTIANTYGPPPDGSTAAGDVVLDTAYNFSPSSKYDFQTVILHELGHSLGLAESPQPTSVMYTYFSGVPPVALVLRRRGHPGDLRGEVRRRPPVERAGELALDRPRPHVLPEFRPRGRIRQRQPGDDRRRRILLDRRPPGQRLDAPGRGAGGRPQPPEPQDQRHRPLDRRRHGDRRPPRPVRRPRLGLDPRRGPGPPLLDRRHRGRPRTPSPSGPTRSRSASRAGRRSTRR